MRREWTATSVLGVAVLGWAAAAEAQSGPSERDAFLARAAEASALYADRREAIADGFRRVGPEFPGMGVHWVQTGRVVSGQLAGDRPAVLCYVDLDGVPTLVGLAYTLPLDADESPPAAPFGQEAWHDHSGDVSEESLLLEHPGSLMGGDGGFRLSMVHVWLPLENPAGLLTQNNWRLPFLRAGLEPPAAPSPLVARGLSLGSPGSEYYRELLHWAAGDLAEDHAAIDRALATSARRVDAWVARHAPAPDASALQELEAVWLRLWDELGRTLSPAAFARVRPLSDGH
jgi:hypothetical protein